MNIEDNKLIAEFMGTYLGLEDSKYLEYHKNWNWLMPVVEKIESLGAVDVIIDRYDCIITADDGIAYFKETKSQGRKKIEMVYESVVDFIKWYNTK